MTDRDPLLMPGMFGKKFIIFSVIVIVVATVAVAFFDNTNDEEIDLMNPYKHMQKEQGPYRAIRPEVTDSVGVIKDTTIQE